MNQEQFSTRFPLGTHICREPMPSMREMKHDMEVMKEKGFNFIKLQEHWQLDEPREGQYNFSKYHELIEHAQMLDMGIYLGITCEQAPNWLYEKYPDCRRELHDGRKAAFQAQSTLHADGKPGPCFDHPGAMAAQLKFMEALITELSVHENIVVWNVWQEIGYWPEMLVNGRICYCENTIRVYREWLTEIYNQDINSLNTHWNVNYPSFEDIVPDRCERPVCIPQTYYYKYFIDHIHTGRNLKARYQAIVANDPLKRPVFAHKGGPEIGSGVDWTYAGCVDFLGSSNYPAWGCGHSWDDHRQKKRLERHDALLTEMWDGLAFKMDYIRCANREKAPIWAAEFQGGPISTDFHLGRTPSAADMRRWMLTTLGAGATAIAFWVTRAEIMAPETNGFSLLDSEGDTTERLEEIAEIGVRLQTYAKLFHTNNKPQAKIGILINEWNYQLLRTMPFAPEAYIYDLRGWYKALWDMGIPCDFVESSRLKEERTKNYKLLLAPMPLSMSHQVARDLFDYASNGGAVVLEGGCGRLNEVAMAVRGQMNSEIKEALQVKVDRFALVREPAEEDRWSQEERTWGEYEEAGFTQGTGILKGTSIKANVFIETYQCAPEDVCLTWQGNPCGIVKEIGKGKMWLLGTCVGPNATAYKEEVSLSGIKQILNNNGIFSSHVGRLLIQKRILSEQEAWFFTNPTTERVTEEVVLPEGFTSAKTLLEGELLIKEGKINVSVESLDVSVVVLER